MDLLGLVQEFSQRNSLKVPSAVAASLDAQVIQLKGLLNELLEELLTVDWSGFTEEIVYPAPGTEDQGLLTTIAPNGFAGIMRGTLFNRSNGLPIIGPMTGQQWQAEKALQVTRALYSFRIRQSRFYLTPAPPIGNQIAFEYQTKWAVVEPVSGTRKQYFTEDNDLCSFSDALLLSGLRWKWRDVKGLDYAEAMRTFELLKGKELRNELQKPEVNLAGGRHDAIPGIYVPAGNWNVS